MKVELTEVTWLDQQQQLSLMELAELSGLLEAEVRELMECDAIVPIERHAAVPRFSADCVIITRRARRLREDFDLDARGLALAVTLLGRIQELQAQLNQLRAQQPQHLRK